MGARAIILVIINIFSILCISLLFITTRIRRIPRHPVVSTLLLTAIPRSIVAALPSFFVHDLQEKLPMSLDARFLAIAEQKTPLATFCASQATLMYFLLATQAAFCISFTVPILLIARHASRLASNPSISQRLKLPSTLALCVCPFVWASPIVFLAIPTVINEPDYPTIYFSEVGYCNIDDWNYQSLSAALVCLPLMAGTGVAIAAIVYVIRFYQNNKGAALRGRTLDFALLFRFAAIVFIILVSGLFLLLEILILDDNRLRWLWSLDIYWEAFTPFFQFLLFASQRSLWRVWSSWIRQIFTGIRLIPSSLLCRDQEASRGTSQDRSDDSTMMTRYRNKAQTEGGTGAPGKSTAAGVKFDERDDSKKEPAVPAPPRPIPEVEYGPESPSAPNTTNAPLGPRRFLNIFRLPPPSSSLSFGSPSDSKKRRHAEAHTATMSADHSTHQYLSKNSILVDWEESDWEEEENEQDEDEDDEEEDSTSIEGQVPNTHEHGQRRRQEPVARLEAEISHFIGTEAVAGPSPPSHGQRHRPHPRPFTVSNASSSGGNGREDVRGRPKNLGGHIGKGKERSLPVPPRAQLKRPTTANSTSRSNSPMSPPSPTSAAALQPPMQTPWSGPSPWSIPRTGSGNGVAVGSSSSQPGSSTAVDDAIDVDEEALVSDGISVSPARMD